ncbi:hypothetical protein SteCoe_25032 [Stentor coeruleus]|uniref:Proliferating cell nuclear antigen n=1 Tax=Stentor coeruleus TaxID=5963 RepID=A0A1R2BGK3_9CILI|nr:hypothetical protein SteCoe_25032 [Stentor coeruleus]
MSSIYLKLSKLGDLLNVLNSLKSIQSNKVQLCLKNEGIFLLSYSSSHTIIGEAFIRNLEFDVYQISKELEISLDFPSLRSVLKSISKSTSGLSITLEYPCKDNKLLIITESECSISQYFLITYDPQPQENLDISGSIIASMKFSDTKIIKQAMEVACNSKSESEVFLSFSTRKPMLYFTREDKITDIKTKVTVPYIEHVECQIIRDCKKTYSAKILKGISNFPKCKEIEIKMHEEGVLEIEVSISDNTLVRYFINPCEN